MNINEMTPEQLRELAAQKEAELKTIKRATLKQDLFHEDRDAFNALWELLQQPLFTKEALCSALENLRQETLKEPLYKKGQKARLIAGDTYNDADWVTDDAHQRPIFQVYSEDNSDFENEYFEDIKVLRR